MNAAERDLITSFVQRVGGAPAGGAFGGAVPATQPPGPPMDREADALLADLFARYPEARYRITQLAFVQEHAMAEAQNVISQLQYQLQQAQQAAQAAQQQAAQPAAPSPWGAAAQSAPAYAPRQATPQYAPQPGYAPPPPQYAPGYAPGMFQQSGGSGFLGSALTTAAGVAGGMVAGNALMNLHVIQKAGSNAHHIAEACFKATARALRQAVTHDPRIGQAIPSTKGAL